MKGKLAFAAGVAAGYVLGSRAGRTSYEHLKNSVKSFCANDSVQEGLHALEHEVKDVADDLGDRIKNTITRVHTPVQDKSTPDQPLGTVGRSGHETASTSAAADVTSDPSLNDQLGQDWADEGGATPDGPATSSS